MPRIIQPVVSPRGRVIVLTGATLWLVAAMVLSATPDGAGADTPVVVRDTVTSLVHSLEELDGAPGILYYPRVSTDARGSAYVADRGQHRVVKLASDLRSAEVVFGGEGAGPGEMRLPHDVAVDSHGNVFVADLALDRITKFAPDGTFVRSVAAPGAASLLVDSQDRLIAYPAMGEALLQRYDNDLEKLDGLLAKTDPRGQRKSISVLIAMGPQDRLYVFDQASLQLSVYDADMRFVREWTVDPPRLRESIEAHVAAMRKRLPEGSQARWNGIQSMALDPSGQNLAFFYLVKEADNKYTQVAWYTADGRYLGVDTRHDTKVLSGALLADGWIMEADAEAFRLLVRRLKSNPTTAGND